MNAVTWLIPIYLPGCDHEMPARAAVAEFDGQGIPSADDRYTMKRVSVPPRCLAGGENQSPYQCRSTVMSVSSSIRLLRGYSRIKTRTWELPESNRHGSLQGNNGQNVGSRHKMLSYIDRPAVRQQPVYDKPT